MISLFQKRGAALAAALCLLLIAAALPAAAEANEAATEILLTFTGDSTLGSEDRLKDKPYAMQAYIRQEGYAYPYAKVQEIFAGDDVTVINLEGVLYDHMKPKVKKTYNFRGPTDFVNIIGQSSIELSFLGNNHTFDYGYQGYRSTVNALEGAGLSWFATTDEGVKTAVFEKNGVKVGFTGAYITYFNNHQEQVLAGLKQLKKEGCAFIVGVMHGGEEYGPRQNRGITRFARFLVDNGADLVVGHHPHVLHGIEIYKGANIVYSLGNFAFGGNTEIRERRTMILQAALRFDARGRYLEQQLNLLPAFTSGTAEYNNFQPVLATGTDAEGIIALVGTMTDFELAPYVEGKGAVQPPLSAERRVRGE